MNRKRSEARSGTIAGSGNIPLTATREVRKGDSTSSRRFIRNCGFAGAFLLCLAAASAQSLLDQKAPDFSLRDQYDQPYDVRQGEGRTIILLASDGEGAKHNREWVDAIEGRYGHRIPIVGIADTRKVPFFMRPAVRSEFRKSAAHILLDWKGVVFTTYGLAPNVPNIVLIDRTGIVRWLYAGEITDAAGKRLFREIDKIEPARGK